MKDLPPEIFLNEYQLAAVTDESPSVMVNACVGSGKTTVLTEKVRYLHEKRGIPYERMMVLTFTNRVADEIRERLGLAPALRAEDESSAENDDGLLFGTFHSAARRLLMSFPETEALGFSPEFSVILPEEELELALSLIAAHKLKIKYKNRLRKRLEQERTDIINGGAGKYGDDLPRLLTLLSAEKKAQNRMSFADLMDFCTEILKLHPYHPDYILVDEVQDSNGKQLEFLKLLRGPDTGFFAVGDPNQLIYSFRGSEGTLFYKIKYEFEAKELSLPVNYRSEPYILALANRFRQFGEKIGSREKASEAICAAVPLDKKIPIRQYYDPFLEAELLAERIRELIQSGIPAEEIAILYRLKEQGEKPEKALEKAGISGVRLMTVHASKGLEFHTVFLIGLNKGLFPLIQKQETALEEEQRLFFVGITRAKKQLELSWYTNPDQVRALGEPGPFLERIPPELCERDERTAKEKTEHLKLLRDEAAELIRKKHADEEGAEEEQGKTQETHEKSEIPAQPEALTRIRHPKYGDGILIREDDMTWEAEFPGIGRKEFLKMFEPVVKTD